MQKNIPTKKSLPEMQQEFERIKNLEIRSRLKELPRLYGDIVRSYHEDTSIQELKFFMHVLKYMIKFEFRSPNQKKRFFSKLYFHWLRLTGNENVIIIKKKSGQICVDSAAIAIYDPNHPNLQNLVMHPNYSFDKEWLRLLNQGEAFILPTGADGIYNVQIRITDALEPVVTEKEMRFVQESTGESAVISIPSGKITVSDPAWLYLGKINNPDDPEEFLTIDATPGNYKICVYHFMIPNKVESTYIVLCKTDAEATNDLSKLSGWEI